MANLPATVSRNTTPVETEATINALVEQMSRGVHPRDIARRIYPKDRAARTRLYRRLVHTALHDQRVAERLAARANLELMVGLVPAVKGLRERAARRNVPAAKLMLEATGVHNPRVKHEHSGEITIRVQAPRPKFEDAGPAYVDADVVDEA